MKYFNYAKSRHLTHALAALKPKLRYVTAKRRWYAARLGLYKTVLIHLPLLSVCTRRHTLVSTIANIKRQNLSNQEAIGAIKSILSQKRYSKFHKEFIKEIISFYPDLILDFLENHLDDLDQSYYKGLYIALLQKNYGLDSNTNKCLSNFLLCKSEEEYIDRKCLYNNIILNESLTKFDNLNEIFNYHKLALIGLGADQSQFIVTNLRAVAQREFESRSQKHKVTVIVTTYNASETIENCIHSLLQQTWKNLEIIVVDDASTDDTLLRLQQLNNHYKNLTVITLPQNVGTFAAKSIGSQYATGEFLTCQDSDDWAHPQKIAEQVQPLIDDSNIIATTSYWLRLDGNGQYYVRQMYPFMRQNPASPMFRLQIVKQKIGLWHIVRTGADSEFFERLKLIYGSESIVVITKPLTIASHRPNSLMTSEQFGIYNRKAALTRLDYWEAWRLWHIDTLYQKVCLTMPSIEQQTNAPQAVFNGIPDSIKVDVPSLKNSLATHRLLNKL